MEKNSISQTNRTMLFEEINPDKIDLLTLLSEENYTSLSDDKIKEINQNLLVSSFDEFLERFVPTLYGVFDAIENKVKFSLKKPESTNILVKEIPLNKQNGFLSLILDLMEKQIDHGDSHQMYQFEQLLDVILPEQEINYLRQIRLTMLAAYRKYIAAPASELEKKTVLLGKVKKILETEMERYQDVLSLLPLAIEDLKRRIFPQQKNVHSWNPILDGISNMVERDLQILDLPNQGEIDVTDLNSAQRNELREIILEQCRKHCNHMGSYTEHLILRSYGLEPFSEGENVERLVEQSNRYLEFYTETCSELITTAKPLIEKILGVKAFFLQYRVKQEGMAPQLLITNVNNDLWVNYHQAERLNIYLNTVNCKINYENTVWFAILPNLTFPPDKIENLSRKRFKGNIEKNIKRSNSIALAENIMTILYRYHILTFLSFECDESTTFAYTSEHGIAHFITGSRKFMGKDYSEYAVLCVPNFTLIPKGKSYLLAGKKIIVTEGSKPVYSSKKQDGQRIWLEGIHVEASYVASGLIACWQCPEYLRERYGSKVAAEFPGVRYDIEQGEHWLKTITVMGRENSGYPKEVLLEIEKEKFGFIFSAESDTNITVNGATVLRARTLGKNSGSYEAVFKVLTANYIERILRYETYDYKKTEIIKFFKSHSDSTYHRWKSSQKYINGILQHKDQLKYSLDEEHNVCILELTLADDPKKRVIDLNLSSPMEGVE